MPVGPSDHGLCDLYKVPISLALGVVVLVLGASVVASLLFPQRAAAHDPVIHDPLAPKPDPAVAPIQPGAEDGRGPA